MRRVRRDTYTTRARELRLIVHGIHACRSFLPVIYIFQGKRVVCVYRYRLRIVKYSQHEDSARERERHIHTRVYSTCLYARCVPRCSGYISLSYFSRPNVMGTWSNTARE